MQFEKVHNLTVCGCEAELSHWFVMSFLNHPLGCALIYNCVFFHLRENWSCIKNNLVMFCRSITFIKDINLPD